MQLKKTYIIAEAGVNHDGSEARARELIDIAAEAGADAVKFQLFSPELLVTGTAKTAAYQAKNLGDSAISQRKMLEKLTLPDGALPRLNDHCDARGIDFLCTPFDAQSMDYLLKHTRMRALKLPSGEVTNGPLLLQAARGGLPVILSTGMASLEEVRVALSVLSHGFSRKAGAPTLAQLSAEDCHALRDKVAILHCVSQYPAPVSATNLRAMDALAAAFDLPVGLSDHSIGINVSVAAVARGAQIIEKHFTYDVAASGPDHAASLTPEHLRALVTAIREVEAALGDGVKQCQPEEENTRDIARKSVVAARAIQQGEAFTTENITCKRPATGDLAPNALWELLGKRAQQDYAADAFIAKKECA